MADKSQYVYGADAGQGCLSNDDDGSISETTWREFQLMLNKSVNAGQLFTNVIMSTYSLIHIYASAYNGGILTPNGDIHFVPYGALVGQKVNYITGVVSTYSLVYTTSAGFIGGVLAPNGDIHFVPYSAPVGQKVSVTGVVSTYSLVYTTSGA
jgi:hypothetical protein